MTAFDTPLRDAFDRAASTYDAMVALSPGYHAQLRRSADELVAELGSTATVLDLGCGSGASTQAIVNSWSARGGHLEDLCVTGVDASAGMVAQAVTKTWPTQVTFTVSDAVAWLEGHGDGTVDAVMAAYLLRNVENRDELLAQITRVLRPGGVTVIHEYSVAGSAQARAIWSAVCHGVIIPLARIKRSDVPLHHYLYRSVRDFDTVARVQERMISAGLAGVRHLDHHGWQRGLVHTFVGVRP